MTLRKSLVVAALMVVVSISVFLASSSVVAFEIVSTPTEFQPTFDPTRLAQPPTVMPPGQGVPIADTLLTVATGQLVESEEAVVYDLDEVRTFPAVGGDDAMGQPDGGILC